MGKKVELRFLIKRGQATPQPPLGPALGQLGLPVGRVVADINKAIAKWKGMTIPVRIIVDTTERKWEIIPEPPLTSALIKKEAGIEKGASNPIKEWVGNLTLEQVVKIAKMKLEYMVVKDIKGAIKQILGTMRNMGVKCEDRDPKEIIHNLDEWLKKKNIKLD